MTPYTWTRARRFRAGTEATPEEARVHRGLDLVIDGFPGSANSFATRAFRAMQDGGCLVGNHYHSPAETIHAFKLGIPVLLTLRRPMDAVNSMVRRWPVVPFPSALRWYLMFHQAMEPYCGDIVVSDFAATTGDFSGVVEAVNRAFGTDFGVSMPADRLAEFEPRMREAGDPAAEARRAAEKKELEERFRAAVEPAALERAESLYQRLRLESVLP